MPSYLLKFLYLPLLTMFILFTGCTTTFTPTTDNTYSGFNTITGELLISDMKNYSFMIDAQNVTYYLVTTKTAPTNYNQLLGTKVMAQGRITGTSKTRKLEFSPTVIYQEPRIKKKPLPNKTSSA